MITALGIILGVVWTLWGLLQWFGAGMATVPDAYLAARGTRSVIFGIGIFGASVLWGMGVLG